MPVAAENAAASAAKVIREKRLREIGNNGWIERQIYSQQRDGMQLRHDLETDPLAS
jgi:hypothetical protein